MAAGLVTAEDYFEVMGLTLNVRRCELVTGSAEIATWHTALVGNVNAIFTESDQTINNVISQHLKATLGINCKVESRNVRVGVGSFPVEVEITVDIAGLYNPETNRPLVSSLKGSLG